MIGQLFDDGALRDFLRHGYALIDSDQPPEFHRDVCDRLDHIMESEGNPGNNILPRVPEIQTIFDTPSVQAALTRILGPGYVMHPHRHCHHRPPGAAPQGWHKDDYVYDQNVRHHRGRWVMAFYYPQAVTTDMGPTAILPGQQHHDTTAALAADPAAEMSITGPAGTVAIVNFDVWHRACANTSQLNRYMLKFQFLRMQEPTQTDTGAWEDAEGVVRYQWDWLRQAAPCTPPASALGDVDTALAKLQGDDEAARLQATYTLAGMGASVVPALVDCLRAEATLRAEVKIAKSPANPAGGNPADLASAHALAAMGPSAIDALVDLAGDSNWSVRATAVDVLGTIGRQTADTSSALIGGLQDDNFWVRRNAAEALGILAATDGAEDIGHVLQDEDWRVRLNGSGALARIGPPAASLAGKVVPLLADENRYVRDSALQTLRRFDSPEATDILLRHLTTSRWCPLTSKDSTF
ncbi:MAG TPA: hypothetical protein DIC52_19915 [Candidatus Latescibacteria bacterium]|nr:hypothetical protein [Candidatus Latescibacterota bacterium]